MKSLSLERFCAAAWGRCISLVDYFHTGATVFDIPPSYNIAPTTFQPVIRLDRDTGEREIAMMRWGLIPPGARM